MKISFEKWLEDNRLPQSAVEMFKESIICYKVSAYKSSFLMAYSGLQIIIKERLLTANCKPNSMEEGQWNCILQKLGNEDKWDAVVFDCVNRCDDKRLFLINNAIIAQYNALRTYRNICAHGKRGEISYYHIELLWGFIQDNFTRFIVIGGKDGIIQMIEDHFDITINAPNKDATYLIDNIEITVKDEELNDFISDLYNYTANQSDHYCSVFNGRNRIIALWDKLLSESSSRLRDSILLFIKNSSIEIISDFVANYPQTVNELLSDDSFARKMWTGEMFKKPSHEDGIWRILEVIIHNDLIPDDEKEDFNKRLYKYQGQFYSKNEIELLKMTKYFEYLSKDLFNISSYSGYESGIYYANEVAFRFVKYINDFGLNLDAVKCINCIFNFATYGAFVEQIRDWMKKDSHINEYQKIVKDNELKDFSTKFLIES